MFAFTSVRLHQSVWFFFCGRFHQNVSFNRLCLHQNVCLYSCALSSKRLLLPVCAYIKSLLFCVRFHQNVCFDSCALTSKVCFFVCTFIKTFPFTGVHLHQNVCLNSCSPRSKFLLLPVCAYIKSFFLCGLSSKGLL